MATAKMCNICQTDHNENGECAQMISHPIISKEDTSHYDRAVSCLIHTDRKLEFYCTNCNLLICHLCNGTTHKHHKAETIPTGVTGLRKRVTKLKDKLIVKAESEKKM